MPHVLEKDSDKFQTKVSIHPVSPSFLNKFAYFTECDRRGLFIHLENADKLQQIVDCLKKIDDYWDWVEAHDGLPLTAMK